MVALSFQTILLSRVIIIFAIPSTYKKAIVTIAKGEVIDFYDGI
jgi:hypothetical protein